MSSTVTPTVSASYVACKSGWTLYADAGGQEGNPSCLMVVTTTQDYSKSLAKCTALGFGAHSLTIKSMQARSTGELYQAAYALARGGWPTGPSRLRRYGKAVGGTAS